MNTLVEIRKQELICRERAVLDPRHKLFWLAEAERWEQRAVDEIALLFRHCDLDGSESRTKAHQA